MPKTAYHYVTDVESKVRDYVRAHSGCGTMDVMRDLGLTAVMMG